MRYLLSICVLLTVFIFSSLDVQACDTPLYRYALERWTSAPYLVLVFHKGSLTPAEKLSFEKLENLSNDRKQPINLWVQAVDVSDVKADEKLLKIWKEAGSKEELQMIVRYPEGQGIQKNAWEAPLTQENVSALIDSPARRELAKRLLKGETAVWLVLESEQVKPSDDVAKEIEDACHKTIPILQSPEGSDAPETEGRLKLAYSTLKVKEKDPAERFFVASIFNQQPSYEGSITGPFFSPVFGQGRLLWAYSSAQKKEDFIMRICSFVCTPCVCSMQDQKVGVELLMSVNWAKFEGPPQVVDKDLPSLSGFAGDGISTEVSKSDPVADTTGSALIDKNLKDLKKELSTDSTVASHSGSIALTLDLGMVLGGAVLVLLFVTVFLLSRGSKE